MGVRLDGSSWLLGGARGTGVEPGLVATAGRLPGGCWETGAKLGVALQLPGGAWGLGMKLGGPLRLPWSPGRIGVELGAALRLPWGRCA